MRLRLTRAIEAVLFTLTGSPRCMALVVVTTLGAWFVLSNHVLDGFALWRAELEATAFLWASGAVAVTVTLLSRALIGRALHGVRPRAISGNGAERFVELAPVTGKEPCDIVRVLIQSVVDRDDVAAARPFLIWKYWRLDSLGSRPQDTWWRSGRAWLRTWPRILWLPALCTALYVAPSVPWFERVVTLVSGQRIGIFDIVAEGTLPSKPGAAQKGQWVQESMLHVPGTKIWRRSATGLLDDVTLTIKSTSFPHANYHVLAVCAGASPQCEIVLDGGRTRVSRLDVPVHKGRAVLRLFKQGTDASLNLQLWQVRANGTVVDEAMVEPLADPE